MAGRYFGQWAIGDRVEHALHRTVTETDNLLFSSLTLDGSCLFYDADATAKLELLLKLGEQPIQENDVGR